MSTYVATHLGQHCNARVEKVVLITPGPPRVFGADAVWLENAQHATTRASDLSAMLYGISKSA
jgi:hypothetical protein